MMLEGWKEIGNYLESISGRKRSRFVLMRWALRGLPVKRDPSNRPYADSGALDEWLKRHAFIY
jgi:hypothetical protein